MENINILRFLSALHLDNHMMQQCPQIILKLLLFSTYIKNAQTKLQQQTAIWAKTDKKFMKVINTTGIQMLSPNDVKFDHFCQAKNMTTSVNCEWQTQVSNELEESMRKSPMLLFSKQREPAEWMNFKVSLKKEIILVRSVAFFLPFYHGRH